MNWYVKSTCCAFLGVICFAISSEAQPPGRPAEQPAPIGNPNTIGLMRSGGTPGADWIQYSVPLWGSDNGMAQAMQLAKQIVEAKTDAEKEKLKDTLKETLNKQFENRQKHHEQELAALEAQVKKLKEMVAKRQENKKEIIEEKIKQLDREAKGLGW